MSVSANMIAARSWFVRRAPKLLCGERWSSNRIAVDGVTAAKPLSEMPTPRGALPFLGHQLLLREHRQKISQLYYDLSKQFGPIFKIKLPAGMSCCAIILIRTLPLILAILRDLFLLSALSPTSIDFTGGTISCQSWELFRKHLQTIQFLLQAHNILYNCH